VQGATTNSAVLIPPRRSGFAGLSLRQLYVAASRPRQKLSILIVSEPFFDRRYSRVRDMNEKSLSAFGKSNTQRMVATRHVKKLVCDF
jgi:ATP-dependent exoDNAse (exonuclease V) alpha subunit